MQSKHRFPSIPLIMELFNIRRTRAKYIQKDAVEILTGCLHERNQKEILMDEAKQQLIHENQSRRRTNE